VLPPTAEATATSTKATLGYQLSGKGTTAASGHKITSWVWNLGNKVVGRKETIDVKLPAYNTKYSYTLTVTQSGGETGSASVTVEETLVKRVTTKTVTTQLTVSSDTLFAWNSFALTARAKAELSAVRAVIKASRSRYVVISGYCDDTGDNDPVSVGNTYNVWLSTERALAVADFLYDNKIPKTTKLVGYGRTHFVATNATAAGRAENRRVTIQFE
jgi:outer membrane protein OmpA-like peptidoglycan-associated protein